MGARVENIITERLRHLTKIVADNKITGFSIKRDELFLLIQSADEVFKGWQFFEDEIYDGMFIQNNQAVI